MNEKNETPAEVQSKEAPPVLQFDPPCAVFRMEVDTEASVERIVQAPIKRHELKSRMRVAIHNPFKADGERFLPGVVYGNGIEFVLDVGASFGHLAFNETLGWCCTALVPKSPVMEGVLQDLLRKIEEPKFTQRLLKRTK